MEPFIGQVQTFAYTFAPRGWLPCDGRLLPITENQALFSLLGTRYGGDGRTTFGIPDFQRKSNKQKILYCIAVQGVYPSRA